MITRESWIDYWNGEDEYGKRDYLSEKHMNIYRHYEDRLRICYVDDYHAFPEKELPREAKNADIVIWHDFWDLVQEECPTKNGRDVTGGTDAFGDLIFWLKFYERG